MHQVALIGINVFKKAHGDVDHYNKADYDNGNKIKEGGKDQEGLYDLVVAFPYRRVKGQDPCKSVEQ